MTTLLVSPMELAGSELAVEGDAYRHLFRARRLAVGDGVRVVDGAGGARAGRVHAVDRRSAVVTLGEALPALEASLRVELLVAPPRSQRARWLVEKATELGAAAVRFVVTERTVREVGGDGLEALRRVAAAAVEQCGRARLPEISGPHEWLAVPDLLRDFDDRLVLDTVPDTVSDTVPGDTAAAPLGVGAPPAGGGRCGLLVGPEGGWTAGERGELAALGCRPVSLGARTLRTETAALAGLARLLAG
jgi:16S rRNA (uracil1498-N3)-methyltransferase